MLLSIDTSGDYVSVALFDQAKCIAYEHSVMSYGQGEALIPCIQSILKKKNKQPKDITKIAVAVGPGSFTGVRIGLAVARAFSLALGIPVVVVNNFIAEAVGVPEKVKVVLDTKRGDFFVQDFDDSKVALDNPCVKTAESLKKEMPFIAVGSGAKNLSEQIGCDLIMKKLTPAQAIGTVVYTYPEAVCGAVPLYLRNADVTI